MIEIVVSVVALVVSIMSAMFSFYLQKIESRRSAREQINKTISELIKLYVENSAAWYTPQESRDWKYYQSLGANGQSMRALCRQAVYIAEQEPVLVTDVEFAMIALSLSIIGDPLLADHYWKKSIERSNTEFFKIENTRGYADFLFRLGKHEMGRNYYRKALEIFDNDTDFHKHTNAYTHQMWMVSEMGNGFSENANDRYIESSRIFRSISHPVTVQSGLNGLEIARQGVLGPGAVATSSLSPGDKSPIPIVNPTGEIE